MNGAGCIMNPRGATIAIELLRASCDVCLQVMRGVGCTVNDMWDHKIDAKVERSRYRPLANGVVTLDQAMIFLAAQV